MKKFEFLFSILLLLGLNSCYKKDVHVVPNLDGPIFEDNARAGDYIKEINSALCYRYNSNGDSSKAIYNLETKTFSTGNYFTPNGSYWAKSTSEIYTAFALPSSNVVSIYNVLDGALVKTFTMNGTVFSVAVAAGKLFVNSQDGFYKKVFIYDLLTDNEIGNYVNNFNLEQMKVSKSGDRIFLGSQSGNTYTFSFELVNNVFKQLGSHLGNSIFADPAFTHISDDGKEIVTNDGFLYNDNLDKITQFNTSLGISKFGISPTGKDAVGMGNNRLEVHQTIANSNYEVVYSIFDYFWVYKSIIPFVNNTNEFSVIVNVKYGKDNRFVIVNP